MHKVNETSPASTNDQATRQESMVRNSVLSILIFDEEDFPPLHPGYSCAIQVVPEKIDEYLRKVVVDVIFVGISPGHLSLTSNLALLGKMSPGSQLIALVNDITEAGTAFANGAADCIIRSQLTADVAMQRSFFVTERARYLRHGGENQLYTQNELAAIARILSHDIRNSLSGIVLSIEPIRQACENDSEAKSYVDILDRSSGKLNQVINRFSTAAGNISLKVKDENFIDLLRHSVATLPETSGREFIILEEYPQEEIIYALDRDKFPQAIHNFLSNAIDAVDGKPGGQIKLKAETDDRDIFISIEDNGHGIDFTTLQNIFRPFFTTRPGKSGLGLPLAKSIIRAHGGNLRIESSNGAGTIVVCRFPMAR